MISFDACLQSETLYFPWAVLKGIGLAVVPAYNIKQYIKAYSVGFLSGSADKHLSHHPEIMSLNPHDATAICGWKSNTPFKVRSNQGYTHSNFVLKCVNLYCLTPLLQPTSWRESDKVSMWMAPPRLPLPINNAGRMFSNTLVLNHYG